MQYINNTKETIPFINVAVAKGDGIGPEIMDVTLNILRHAGAKLKFSFVEIGEEYYRRGFSSGISDDAWEIIRQNKVMLKAPITTPQGGGYKSINVTLRKTLELYANVRPCKSYHPFIATQFTNIDTVIIRENEEDLYAGVEYRLSNNTHTAVKIITKKGCEKIVRYAFEYAKRNNRKKVTCMTKDNIMKSVDGLFHKTFDEIATEYPDIITEHYIIDIGTARIATKPEIFDVIVTLNLYGDIISDVAAELTGSVGLAGSANIGERYAMFEAIHGSAPTLVGQGIANPSALINASVMMLAHVGQGSIAKKIQDALLYTIESGVHTFDIFREGFSAKQVRSDEFGEEVVKNLGKCPDKLSGDIFSDFTFDDRQDGIMLRTDPDAVWNIKTKDKQELVGFDFVVLSESNAKEIGDKVKALAEESEFILEVISSRGIVVYPAQGSNYITSDSWSCRFTKKSGSLIQSDIFNFALYLAQNGIDIAQVNNLYNFAGKLGYSKVQGE